MLNIIVNIINMKLSDFLISPLSTRRKIAKEISNDIVIERIKDEMHRREIESNISRRLIPYIKRKGIFVSCLNSDGSMDRNRHLASISNIKWLNPKIIDKVNQTLSEAKTLKKEYKMKKKSHSEEFKKIKSEIKTNYKGEIDILQSAVKRIIETGHPYLI